MITLHIELGNLNVETLEELAEVISAVFGEVIHR
jgi:hypothetical protein